jgi:hypothetical protein
MTDESLPQLLSTIGIAAFERRGDGTFAPVSPAPAWFQRLAGDATFPFLGHILEDAGQFWRRGHVGSEEYGPCAAVDEHGREFHYKVTAVSIATSRYLLFQLDAASDRLRDVLQAARDKSLHAEMSGVTLLSREAVAAISNAAAAVEHAAHRIAQTQTPEQQPQVSALLDAAARLSATLRR